MNLTTIFLVYVVFVCASELKAQESELPENKVTPNVDPLLEVAEKSPQVLDLLAKYPDPKDFREFLINHMIDHYRGVYDREDLTKNEKFSLKTDIGDLIAHEKNYDHDPEETLSIFSKHNDNIGKLIEQLGYDSAKTTLENKITPTIFSNSAASVRAKKAGIDDELLVVLVDSATKAIDSMKNGEQKN